MSAMRDINEIMPRVPNMRWGALTNYRPTPRRVAEMSNIFPANGKWHTVFDEDDQVIIDGKRVWKKNAEAWT